MYDSGRKNTVICMRPKLLALRFKKQGPGAPGNRTLLKNLVNHDHINTFRKINVSERSTDGIKKEKVLWRIFIKKLSLVIKLIYKT